MMERAGLAGGVAVKRSHDRGSARPLEMEVAVAGLGRIVIIIGVALIVLGVALTAGARLGLGSLPGDLKIEREDWTLYLPVTSSILVSVVLTIVLNLLARFFAGK